MPKSRYLAFVMALLFVGANLLVLNTDRAGSMQMSGSAQTSTVRLTLKQACKQYPNHCKERFGQAIKKQSKEITLRKLSKTRYLSSKNARKLGRILAAKRGWKGGHWRCLDSLWGEHESSWRVTADNPRSTAYGIPQALPGSKMGDGWQYSAFVQIKWGLNYISGRYGSPCSALSFRLAQGWY